MRFARPVERIVAPPAAAAAAAAAAVTAAAATAHRMSLRMLTGDDPGVGRTLRFFVTLVIKNIRITFTLVPFFVLSSPLHPSKWPFSLILKNS